MEVHKEGGYRVYSRFLTLAPGQEMTVQLDLMGDLPLGDQYRLVVGHQPLVNPDGLSARVEFERGWYITNATGQGLQSGSQEAEITMQQSAPQVMAATVKEHEY